MLTDAQDAMGHALWDHVHGREAHEVIEREDGYADAIPITTYLRTADAWSRVTRDALDFAKGRVLDVGVGGGQHAIHLQERGHDVCGVDISPLSVEVCRLRGLEDARGSAATQIGPHLGLFDTILMMSNNFGLVSDRKRAPWLMKRFAAITSPEAIVIAQSTDAAATEDPIHLAYQRQNRARGRMPGQIRLRIRYRIWCSPWSDYLLASPEEMEDLLRKTPWRIREILDDAASPAYTAILEKR